MKYKENEKVVTAIYDSSISNPLVAAMPPSHSVREFINSLEYSPPFPENINSLTYIQRREAIEDIHSFFFPMGYMYRIYLDLRAAIISTYESSNAFTSTIGVNCIYAGLSPSYEKQPINQAILGYPGVGKTSTIKKCLALYPQIIEHTSYNNYFRQILYLHVQCPSDCSIKGMAANILSAIYNALGSQIDPSVNQSNKTSADVLIHKVKALCITHHIGLIVVDEIQNVISVAKSGNQTRRLIKFLVELTNDTNTAMCFVGTLSAETILSQEEHLHRRTRGLRLAPMTFNSATYQSYIKAIWKYQYTPKTAPLTDELAKDLYSYTSGIPAYINMVFRVAQIEALGAGAQCISSSFLKEAMNSLRIIPSNIQEYGKSISDFSFPTTDEMDNSDTLSEITQSPLKASRKGRKKTERSVYDLVENYKNGTMKILEECGMVVIYKC